MIEKSLIIILFMYSVSISVAAGQWVVADVIGVTLVNIDGVPIQSHILGLVNEDSFNAVTANIVNANYTGNSTFFDKIETSVTGAAYIAWELATLLTGTYIFNFMYLMGVPLYFVLLFLFLYIFLLARTLVGLIRGT